MAPKQKLCSSALPINCEMLVLLLCLLMVLQSKKSSDATLSFEPFVQNTVQKSFFHLSPQTLVFSHVDYCYGLLAGVSKSSINNLQYLQNSAAGILSVVRAGDHITRFGLFALAPC